MCSLKLYLQKILQNSHKNRALRICNFIKKDSGTTAFLRILNIFFEEHLRMIASTKCFIKLSINFRQRFT